MLKLQHLQTEYKGTRLTDTETFWPVIAGKLRLLSLMRLITALLVSPCGNMLITFTRRVHRKKKPLVVFTTSGADLRVHMLSVLSVCT